MISDTIQTLLNQAIMQAFPASSIKTIPLEIPQNPDHGEYASAIALQLAKTLEKNPRDIAQQIILHLQEKTLFSAITIAGPGFINFFLTPKTLLSQLQTIVEKPTEYGKNTTGTGKTIIFEYSHPNIAKPMSVGHLRSTIIGESLKRIYQALGYTVIADNYLGDWGTQFGKLVYAYKNWGDKKKIEKNPIKEFLKLYVLFHQKAEKDLKLEDYARQEFRKLEQGNKENRALWQWIVTESLKEIQTIYQQLNASFSFIHGESFYEPMLPSVLAELLNKKIATKNPDHSVGVLLDEFKLPSTIIQRSDGATLYITRDLAADKYYQEQYKPEKVIHVVGNEQTLYFKQLAAIRKKLNSPHEIIHVSFGMVRLPEGRMSTRKGRVIFLEDLIYETTKRAYALIASKPGLRPREKKKIAQIVGLGAIKYNDLSQNRKTDIIFDWEKMLNLNGNSAPYLQYTYARIQSVFNKAHNNTPVVNPRAPLDQEEKMLIRHLLYFPTIIEQAARDYTPNLICAYLYELASLYNTFYQKVPILKSREEKRQLRLAISQGIAVVLKQGLYLLGIDVVEKM